MTQPHWPQSTWLGLTYFKRLIFDGMSAKVSRFCCSRSNPANASKGGGTDVVVVAIEMSPDAQPVPRNGDVGAGVADQTVAGQLAKRRVSPGIPEPLVRIGSPPGPGSGSAQAHDDPSDDPPPGVGPGFRGPNRCEARQSLQVVPSF